MRTAFVKVCVVSPLQLSWLGSHVMRWTIPAWVCHTEKKRRRLEHGAWRRRRKACRLKLPLRRSPCSWPWSSEAKNIPEAPAEILPRNNTETTEMPKLISVTKNAKLPTSHTAISEIKKQDLKAKQETDDMLKDCFGKCGIDFTTRSGNSYKFPFTERTGSSSRT